MNKIKFSIIKNYKGDIVFSRGEQVNFEVSQSNNEDTFQFVAVLQNGPI